MSGIPEKIKERIEEIKHKCELIKPKVAIHSLAYNHGPYIKEALEGFINQKTDFPFVAIVHDDVSKDNTVAILCEYAEKYPDIIIPIFETENQYSKPNGSLENIMNSAMSATGAKYIAMCECDDYWTEPLKLQKQVDFLESHPEYSVCFHNAIIEDCHNRTYYKFNNFSNDVDLSFYDIVNKWQIPTASILLKSEYLFNMPSDLANIYSGDYKLLIWLRICGKVHYINIIGSIYRLNSSPTSASVLYRNKNISLINQKIKLLKSFIPHLKNQSFNYIIKDRLNYLNKEKEFQTIRLERMYYKLPKYFIFILLKVYNKIRHK